MKIKKEYIVLAAIILCLSLYLVFQKTDKTGYNLPDIPDISKKEISKIEINITAKEPITLNKADNKWTIAPKDYPADSGKVESIIDIINDITLTALVSESKNFVRYDLGDDKKINVNAWEGTTLLRSFDIGKTASTNRHTFVKIKDDNRVFHARENLRNKFDLTVDKLRDKTVLSFNDADIQELSVTNKGKTLSLAISQIPVEVSADPGNKPDNKSDKNKDKKEEKTPPETQPVWQDQDGNQADKSKVDRLLSSLSKLECESYLKGKAKKDFADMEPIYTVKLKGPEEYSLTIFAKNDEDETGYPSISSHNAYPFMLAGFQADNIMNGLEDKNK